MLKKWDELPDFMRSDEVRPYYDILKRKMLGSKEFVKTI